MHHAHPEDDAEALDRLLLAEAELDAAESVDLAVATNAELVMMCERTRSALADMTRTLRSILERR